jgi:hypothetical protein
VRQLVDQVRFVYIHRTAFAQFGKILQPDGVKWLSIHRYIPSGRINFCKNNTSPPLFQTNLAVCSPIATVCPNFAPRTNFSFAAGAKNRDIYRIFAIWKIS